MSSVPLRFPPHPVRGVQVLHQKQNCAPQFAQIEVDFEPAAEGFTFEVALEAPVDHEPSEELSRFFAAAAAGIKEQLSLPEHHIVIAARVVLRRARTDRFGSNNLAFKIAGFLAARQALERAQCLRPS
ncbi:hypothetical protein [Streptomyces sp. NPDC059639]|uniref:hypothetical protein n=1 Tax=Streptomyces sp. NPDC059639 TaxID=3346891 RepID=UPI00368A9189